MPVIRIFRFTSILMIIVGFAHPVGHFLSKRPLNDTETKLFHLMEVYQKDVLGGAMAMSEIVDGLNLCYGLFIIAIGSINLYVSRGTKSMHLIDTLSRIESICFFFLTVISLIYFYWLPVVYASVISVSFAWAGFKKRAV